MSLSLYSGWRGWRPMRVSCSPSWTPAGPGCLPPVLMCSHSGGPVPVPAAGLPATAEGCGDAAMCLRRFAGICPELERTQWEPSFKRRPPPPFWKGRLVAHSSEKLRLCLCQSGGELTLAERGCCRWQRRGPARLPLLGRGLCRDGIATKTCVMAAGWLCPGTWHFLSPGGSNTPAPTRVFPRS